MTDKKLTTCFKCSGKGKYFKRGTIPGHGYMKKCSICKGKGER